MADIFKVADEATIEWLLEKENPSVRRFTLRKLLGKSSADEDAAEAGRSIMIDGVVPRILNAQSASGSWGDPDRFYLDKYRGGVWQLLILAELGAAPEDPRVRRACDFILENSQDGESFGFSVHRGAKGAGGRPSEVIPCLTGNMVWSLVRLGLLNDERVQKAIEWICRYQRCDDGIEDPPSGRPYERLEDCWGRHTCHMGVVKALKALAAIHRNDGSVAVVSKISELTEYLLVHRIYKKSRDPAKVSRPGWLKFGFPLMYQTDVLEILTILTDLGVRDPRTAEALDIVRSKRGPEGRWKMENSFNGKMLVDIEEKGADSKWITARALYVLGNNG